MSLINDALKQAKQAHEQKPAPQFHGAPLHTHPVTKPKSALMPVLLGVAALFVVLIAVIAMLLVKTFNVSAKTVSVATSQPAAPVARVAEPIPVAATPAAVSLAASESQPTALQPQVVPAASGEPATQSLPVTTTVDSPAPPATATVAATETAVESTPNAHLQGILYNPTRPAAIINGRTMYVGERLKDIRLVDVTPESATVLWNEQTIELTLER